MTDAEYAVHQADLKSFAAQKVAEAEKAEARAEVILKRAEEERLAAEKAAAAAAAASEAAAAAVVVLER